MLQAYVDDSGSENRPDKRLVLAGYILSANDWANFSVEWAVALAQPPRLAVLHMSAGFPGFDNKERAAKIDALVEVLSRYRPLSFECMVSRKDYEDILRPNAPYDLRHPYFPCFVGVLSLAAKSVSEEGLEGPIDLIFDAQGNVGAGAAAWYLPIKKRDPHLARLLGGPPSFKDDQEALPLQAADLLAWHVRKCSEPKVTRREREVADAIRFRHRYMELTKETLVGWAAAFSQVPGIEATKSRESSVQTEIERLTSTVPPDQIVPVLNALQKRGERLHQIKRYVERMRLGFLWRRIAARKWRLR